MTDKFYYIKGLDTDCKVKILFNVLPIELADIKQYDKINTQQHFIKLFNKEKIPIPRLQTSFGNKGISYSYSNSRVVANEWDSFILKVKKRVENITNLRYNFVLINKYRDGNDYIGYHSDDEKELSGPIVSITIGAVRDFKLKHKKTKEVITIPLPHNSCLIFDEKTNSRYKHSVPKRKKCKNVRYNLTFRTIIN